MFTTLQPPISSTSPDEKEATATTPEDEEVVQRLHLLLLLRPIRPGDQRGAADEAEIPADPEQDQAPARNGRPTVPESATSAQPMRSSSPVATIALGPEARDQRAGHEARPEHGEHMPLDAEHGGVLADGGAAPWRAAPRSSRSSSARRRRWRSRRRRGIPAAGRSRRAAGRRCRPLRRRAAECRGNSRTSAASEAEPGRRDIGAGERNRREEVAQYG